MEIIKPRENSLSQPKPTRLWPPAVSRCFGSFHPSLSFVILRTVTRVMLLNTNPIATFLLKILLAFAFRKSPNLLTGQTKLRGPITVLAARLARPLLMPCVCRTY